MKELVREEMCGAYELDPPLGVDVGSGADWTEAEELSASGAPTGGRRQCLSQTGSTLVNSGQLRFGWLTGPRQRRLTKARLY